MSATTSASNIIMISISLRTTGFLFLLGLSLPGISTNGFARAPDTSVTTNLPLYINGNWCLNQEKYEDDVSYSGEIWQFEDGNYSFNGLGKDPYYIKEDTIKMDNFGTLKVLEISEKKMVAKIYSTYYFSKDRCEDDTLEAIKLTRVNNAIIKNDIKEVKRLIDEGVDISKRDTRGSMRSTPLMLAILEENIPIIKLLLQQKPDLGMTNYSGKTALDFAKLSKSTEIRELIQNEYQ